MPGEDDWVALWVGASDGRVVGRERERQLLEDAVRAAAGAVPCVRVVHGEAGLGKTTLVRAVADDLTQDGFTVLWGAALRFGAVQAAALPLVMAVEGWFRRASPADREDLLSSVQGAARLLPSLGGTPDDVPAATLVLTLDVVLSHLSADGPVLLVVDDVQWADPVSRDALAYLVAGLTGRRIAVLATCRDEELGAEESGLRDWLADLRRLPFVRELRLARLDAEQTEEQVAVLLGSAPHPRLATQVHERSAGVPYLTELLVQGLDARAERLPPGLPDALSQAVQASWQRLSPGSRQTLQVLAVSGGRAARDELASVCARAGLSRTTVDRAVLEGMAAAVVEETDGRLWFRHPLLAETLALAMPAPERAAAHGAWADALSGSRRSGVDELTRLGRLALHLQESGRPDEAFAVSMAAADLSHATGALKVEAVHLRRALESRAASETKPGDELALLERAAIVMADTGKNVTAADLLERAVSLVDPDRDPLAYSRLTIRLAETCWFLGRTEEQPVAVARRAVELCAPHPDSWEYADALSELSGCLAWEGQVEEARSVADQAVAVARRLGDPRALSTAYEVRTYSTSDLATFDADSAESLRQARACADQDLLTSAVIARGNYLVEAGRAGDAGAVHAEALASALAKGADSHVVLHAAEVARHLLVEARFDEAALAVREGLVRTSDSHAAASLRMQAWTLALRRGAVDAADQHVARAYELLPSLESRAGVMAPPALAEHRLAHHDPGAALDLLERTLKVQAIDPRVADLMTLWASRAAADLADRSRDRRDPRGAASARETLDRFLALRSELGSGPNHHPVSGPDIDAMAVVAAVEQRRCSGQATAMEWEQAADACSEARLVWEAWGARLRQAECWVATGRHRPDLGRLLRDLHRQAAEQGAHPTRERAASLARLGSVSLESSAADGGAPSPAAGPFAALTPREREVLAYVVAGSTYAEIAGELVISEKTVSVHVSNLLRKTDTGSRRELAALALRSREQQGS